LSSGPDVGGLTINPTATWPMVFEQSDTEANFVSCALTAVSMFVSSKYPPRKPHSPVKPLEMEWKLTSGIFEFRSLTIFLKLMNGGASP